MTKNVCYSLNIISCSLNGYKDNIISFFNMLVNAMKIPSIVLVCLNVKL